MLMANNIKEYLLKLKLVVDFLISKWLVITVASILGGSIAGFYAYNKKRLYVASLVFVAQEEKNSNSGAFSGLANQLGLGGMASGYDVGAYSGDNLIELMLSRPIVESVLLSKVDTGNNKSIAEVYMENHGWYNKWSAFIKKISLPVVADRKILKREQDSLLESIYNEIRKEYLTVGLKDKKTTFIEAKMKSQNEWLSKRFVETLVERVSDSYVHIKAQKYIDNVAILQKQTDSIRNILNHAVAGAAYSNDATFNLNPALQRTRLPVQLKQFDIQANTAILIELVKNLEEAKLSLLKETPLIQVIEKPIYPLPIQKLRLKLAFVFGALIAFLMTVFGLLVMRLWKNLLS